MAANIQSSGSKDYFFHLIVGNGNLGKEQILGLDVNVFQRFLLKRKIMNYFTGIHGLGSEIKRFILKFKSINLYSGFMDSEE